MFWTFYPYIYIEVLGCPSGWNSVKFLIDLNVTVRMVTLQLVMLPAMLVFYSNYQESVLFLSATFNEKNSRLELICVVNHTPKECYLCDLQDYIFFSAEKIFEKVVSHDWKFFNSSISFWIISAERSISVSIGAYLKWKNNFQMLGGSCESNHVFGRIQRAPNFAKETNKKTLQDKGAFKFNENDHYEDRSGRVAGTHCNQQQK